MTRGFHKYTPAWRRVFHLRDDGYGTENADLPKRMKCLTIVVLFDASGVLASGGAACGQLDHFNKKIGIAIAEGRAKKAMASALHGEWKPGPEPWKMSVWQAKSEDRMAEAERVAKGIHDFVMGRLTLSAERKGDRWLTM
jgi:hypothetical protein